MLCVEKQSKWGVLEAIDVCCIVWSNCAIPLEVVYRVLVAGYNCGVL